MNVAVVLVRLVKLVENLHTQHLFNIFITDLCPKKPIQNPKSPLSKQSHFEEIEGIPGLFNALLEDEDDKWSVFTFPVDYDSSLYGAKSKDSFYMRKLKIFSIDDIIMM